MTVKRSDVRTIGAEIPLADVVAAVRRVLDSNETYKRTSERLTEDGHSMVFYTYYRPSIPLILGTDMYIRVEPSGEQTRVSVSTQSQPLIIGDIIIADIFGMYDSYISTFFARLSRQIVAQRANY